MTDHRVKVAVMLLKYYSRAASKRFFGAIPLVLFLISFGLFTIALVPNIAHRFASTISAQPERITLTGHVLAERGNGSQRALTPARAAQLEIGGFSATTDPAGSYRIQFLTSRRSGIAVVIRFENSVTVETLDLPPTGGEWSRDWFVVRR